MFSSDNSLSSLHAVGTKVCVEIIVSLSGQRCALSFTDEVGIWEPSDYGMPERELLLVNGDQLVKFLQELAKVRWCRTQVSSENAHGVV